VKNGESSDVLREELLKMGFTHLLIRYDLFNLWAEKQFSDRDKEKLMAFFGKDVSNLQSQAGYGLFQIVKPSIND
jgi:hypothetical protein